MGLRKDETNLTATVNWETHDRIRALAKKSDIPVSRMLAQWIEHGASQALTCTDKLQKVRAHKDELMVSLPMAFVRSAGLRKKDAVTVAFGGNALMIRA